MIYIKTTGNRNSTILLQLLYKVSNILYAAFIHLMLAITPAYLYNYFGARHGAYRAKFGQILSTN